jgi:hypothetical protein
MRNGELLLALALVVIIGVILACFEIGQDRGAGKAFSRKQEEETREFRAKAQPKAA